MFIVMITKCSEAQFSKNYQTNWTWACKYLGHQRTTILLLPLVPNTNLTMTLNCVPRSTIRANYVWVQALKSRMVGSQCMINMHLMLILKFCFRCHIDVSQFIRVSPIQPRRTQVWYWLGTCFISTKYIPLQFNFT